MFWAYLREIGHGEVRGQAKPNAAIHVRNMFVIDELRYVALSS